jgi:DNA-binding YbaB/EbfC family protein
MKDFINLFGQIKEAQAKIKQVQQQIGHLQAIGESGAGLVKATVNGHKKLLAIEIDPSIIQRDDQQLMQDLIIAAINLAIQKIEDKTKESIQETTAGMLGDLPLDLLI